MVHVVEEVLNKSQSVPSDGTWQRAYQIVKLTFPLKITPNVSERIGAGAIGSVEPLSGVRLAIKIAQLETPANKLF